jgi:hypothetical protein
MCERVCLQESVCLAVTRHAHLINTPDAYYLGIQRTSGALTPLQRPGDMCSTIFVAVSTVRFEDEHEWAWATCTHVVHDVAGLPLGFVSPKKLPQLLLAAKPLLGVA